MINWLAENTSELLIGVGVGAEDGDGGGGGGDSSYPANQRREHELL